jgi:hypothetical protein
VGPMGSSNTADTNLGDGPDRACRMMRPPRSTPQLHQSIEAALALGVTAPDAAAAIRARGAAPSLLILIDARGSHPDCCTGLRGE